MEQRMEMPDSDGNGQGVESYMERVKSDTAKEAVHGFFGAFDSLGTRLSSDNEIAIQEIQRRYVGKLRAEGEEDVAGELENMIGASLAEQLEGSPSPAEEDDGE